jgi:predicted CoA-substrate-specific enzyme activase
MGRRFLGIDIGCETIKLAELCESGAGLEWVRGEMHPHDKDPVRVLRDALAGIGWGELDGAVVTGRLSGLVSLPRIPGRAAQARGLRFGHGDEPATVVSIGSHGFSVLELREGGVETYRENSRCSQGTGSFLRQLVERFGLTVEQASELVRDVTDPAPLSGRCPVILKTDMTHLANVGEPKQRILAGLYDAVSENVQVLVKPRLCPPRVALIGGVARAERVRAHFGRFFQRHGLAEIELTGQECLLLEALGCALHAAERPTGVPPLDELIVPPPPLELERVPALSAHLGRVRRMPAPEPPAVDGRDRRLVLGFDIGSTGSKMVALDADSGEVVFKEYGETRGDPVGAAQTLARAFTGHPAARHRVLGTGVTGSGREIVSSLLKTCFGPELVFVLNEIAAHAVGACHYDPRVDTIFEIGGQDAKYIRLDGGRVIDAAMNEACSAGTGSFIAEQGGRFSGVENVVQLGEQALSAEEGVSLGQHCSVFMAEVIDAAIADGVASGPIIAGIYDSVIQNYLNRVKGSRTVGDVIFCQGMPFSAPALAAAVARQTGSEVIVPPDPGLVGAVGIALLASRELTLADERRLDPSRFLEARLLERDGFVCMSKKGCGGSGNRCRIHRIRTEVEGHEQKFVWGGACSLYERGTTRVKLPDRCPDPFRHREELVAEMVERLGRRRSRPTIGLTDEFVLKSLFPFFATYLHELGFDLLVATGGDQGTLKRGIEESNVPFCAPLQLYHGIVAELAAEQPDYLFLPRMRDLPRVQDEPRAFSCPLAQGSPDLLRWDVPAGRRTKILDPVVAMGSDNLDSGELSETCAELARALGVRGHRWRRALEAARDAQRRFDRQCAEIGEEALAFCREHDVLPVVVLGRPYTIYNTILNSNVPAILREQGALPIPVDCYPVPDDVPLLEDVYWGHGQRSLRAATHVRRQPGIYSLLCSNYSCGPDSFTSHFYAFGHEGKPYALIETDGHSGDAGTKTRVEAFLYCARQDRRAQLDGSEGPSLSRLERAKCSVEQARRNGETVLVPRLSEGAEVLTACLQGLGLRAECLPVPDRDALREGRRHTSGKECLPMAVTVGSFLQRIERDPDPDARFVLLMPNAQGPCRFGLYNLLLKVIVERLGRSDRIGVWTPVEKEYFAEAGDGFEGLALAGIATADALLQAKLHVRPVERRPGAAEAIYRRAMDELVALIRREAQRPVGGSRSAWEASTGRLFGCGPLLEGAAREFARAMNDRPMPTVLLVGEIYVRCDPFSNDRVVERLEERGLRVRIAPPGAWFEYTTDLALTRGEKSGLGPRLAQRVLQRTLARTYRIMAEALGWPRRSELGDVLEAAGDYLSPELWGEAVLTVGEALHQWREDAIDGALSVGPLECMPNKLAEAQLFHAAEREGLRTVTLSVNGEPIDEEALDSFAFQVREDFRRRGPRRPVGYRDLRTRGAGREWLREVAGRAGSLLSVRRLEGESGP